MCLLTANLGGTSAQRTAGQEFRTAAVQRPRVQDPPLQHRAAFARWLAVVGVPCFHPLPAVRSSAGVVSLRRFDVERGDGLVMRLPCGSCLGCRLSRAREWALRCHLEASAHQDACWATLTYDEKHVPPTLVKAHLSGFLKRLRARVEPRRVRFFGCGEYGERYGRPHYHVMLFGLPRCPPISDAWSFGFVQQDELTPAAISYVAGYCAKKVGWKLESGQERVDRSTGEVYRHQEPFVLMSRRPGIGASARGDGRSWRDFAVFAGSKVPVPRYLHAAWLDRSTLAERAELLEEKQAKARPFEWDRVRASEVIAKSRQTLNAQRRTKL